MIYEKYLDGVVLRDYDSFDIKQTLYCGQCFRFYDYNNYFLIIAHNRELYLSQDDDKIFFYPCSIEDFENIWINYFDLNRDYSKVKSKLFGINNILDDAIKTFGGIRLLNQEPWECLISFIISQNNRIPQIKKVVNNISEKFGERINNFFSFPSQNKLISQNVCEDDFIKLKAGFRSKYIIDAVYNKQINWNKISSNNINLDLRNCLLKIKGVGEKVADCVLLFSFGERNLFPVDTWIEKISRKIFFDNNEVSKNQIKAFAENKFGKYAGYAQQYLYYYARSYELT
jgi:N-glycosylase/DNA lyase